MRLTVITPLTSDKRRRTLQEQNKDFDDVKGKTYTALTVLSMDTVQKASYRFKVN
jgi:hypothetical protein